MSRTCQLLALAVSVLIAAPQSRAEEAHHWSYTAETGPEHWGEAAPDCKAGKHQSPIDVKTRGKGAAARSKALPRIGFQWKKTTGKVVNNGHTIQVDLEPGSSIDVGGTRYELAQFHFHSPSEHWMDGKQSPMEVHFVHKTAEGKLAVVGVLIDAQGAANAALAPVFKAMGSPAEVQVDLPAILPRKHGYFTYEGSLTTPPCSEGVHWMVLREHLRASQAQVNEFKKIFPAGNARPAQELNGRKVEAAND